MSAKELEDHDIVNNIITLWACPSTSDIDEVTDDEIDLIACERKIWEELKEYADNEGKANVLILDSEAPVSLAKVVHRIFADESNRENILEKQVVVLAIAMNDTEQWRRNFVERFRVLFDFSPLFQAEVNFRRGHNYNISMHVTSYEDRDFIKKLVDIMDNNGERMSGLVPEIKSIRGGYGRFMPDFEPFNFYLPHDYDQKAPLEQWFSQKPQGIQTVIQYEVGINDETRLSADLMKNAVKQTLLMMQTYEVITKFDLHEMTIIGDGCVVVSFLSQGNIIVTWDGKKHVDINIFLFFEDFDFSNVFKKQWKENVPKELTELIVDEQPRGYGRVVNFMEDVTWRDTPHWAHHLHSSRSLYDRAAAYVNGMIEMAF
jgi:hypothetical protein